MNDMIIADDITLRELIELVIKLNEELYDQLQDTGLEDEIYLDCSTNGMGHLIMFLNVQVWSSEDDEREYIDDHNRIGIEVHMRRRMNEILNAISNIQKF